MTIRSHAQPRGPALAAALLCGTVCGFVFSGSALGAEAVKVGPQVVQPSGGVTTRPLSVVAPTKS